MKEAVQDISFNGQSISVNKATLPGDIDPLTRTATSRGQFVLRRINERVFFRSAFRRGNSSFDDSPESGVHHALHVERHGIGHFRETRIQFIIVRTALPLGDQQQWDTRLPPVSLPREYRMEGLGIPWRWQPLHPSWRRREENTRQWLLWIRRKVHRKRLRSLPETIFPSRSNGFPAIALPSSVKPLNQAIQLSVTFCRSSGDSPLRRSVPRKSNMYPF